MRDIEIKIDENGYAEYVERFIGNQYENEASRLVFDLPAGYVGKGYYQYALFNLSNDKTIVRKIVDNKCIIDRDITNVAGLTLIQVIVKNIEGADDLSDGLVICSQPISCYIKPSNYNSDKITNESIDKNILVLLDEFDALLAEIRATDKRLADISNAKVSMTEVIDARGGYITLKNRLDALLSNINKNAIDISTNMNNLDSEVKTRIKAIDDLSKAINSLISGTPLVASSTSEMTDTSRVYVNTTDRNWYYYNGSAWVSGGVYQATETADNSINVSKLDSEVKEQVNVEILNPTLIEGHYISSLGKFGTHNNYNYSEPILLEKNKTIALNATGENTSVSFIAIYDEFNNKYIPVVNSTSNDNVRVSYTTDEDCYVVISGKIGTISKVYIYDNKLSSHIDIISQLEDSNTIISKLTKDKYIVYSNGKTADYIAEDVLYAYEEFMPIIPSVNIVLASSYDLTTGANYKGIAFYDKEFKYLSGVQLTVSKSIVFTTPKDARYMKFTVTDDMYNNGFSLRYENIHDVLKYITSTSINNSIDITKLKDDTSNINNLVTFPLFSSFLKFGVIGDSLASGESVAIENDTNKFIDNYDYSWGQFIARRFGMECVNFSAGGLSTRTWLTHDKGLPKLLESANLCNAYIIGLGVNDYGKLGADYLGTIADIKEDYTTNEETFYGNYGKIIGNIFSIAPKAKIFLLTIPRDNETVSLYNDAIREIANHFNNVYLIDLAQDNLTDYLNGFIEKNKREGHYNALAYNYMATILFNKLSKYMYDNYSEFSQIEFINTDYEY